MYDHSFSGTVITSPMETVDLSDNSDEEIKELVQMALSQGLQMNIKRGEQVTSSRKKFVLLCELIITEYKERVQEEKEYQEKDMEEKQKQLMNQMEEKQRQYDDFQKLLSPNPNPNPNKRKRVNSSSSTLPPASLDNTETFDVDQKVTSCWFKNCQHKDWYPGKITAVHPPTSRKNGIFKYDIEYDDDMKKASNVAFRYIKLQ
jgi:hypothetical protein